MVALAALAAVVAAVLLGGRPATSTPLDPDNPGADGARAVARVLDDQGVEVRVVRGADALDAESLDPSTTVLVTSSYLLGRSTAQRLLDHLSGADLVVAEPGPGVVDALGLSAESWTVAPGADRPAGCADPLYAGLEVRVDVGTEFAAAAGCFTGEHGHLVAEPQAGVTLLGASALLTNDQVLRADNAAVALRLLGQHDRLVWYVPEAGDLLGRDGVSLRTLVPDWILPGLWIAGATVLALLLWRVRRLGPLVVEPLPVTVKAIETTQSRGRLYRKSGDRAHAARALRAGRAGRADRAAAPAAGHRRARARRRPAHRPARRRRPRADRRRRALPRHRRRPDHPGRRAGPAPTRGTPMTTTPEPGSRPARPMRRRPTSDESRERLAAVRAEVAKAVVGQDAAVSGLLVALLCGGHVLMEGVPGVAKTLLVRTLAGALAVQTRRVQFTPDLMPGDITGSMVIDSRQGELSFREGPLFTNLLLADEINRTPPKTQSALLEAMEEGQVSVDGVSRPLPRPFLVAATQNPVEYEGTYPLPGGAARPVPAQGGAADPPARGRAGDPAPARRGLRPARHRRRRGHRGVRARGHRRRPGRGPSRAGLARGDVVHRRHRPCHPRVALAEPRRQPARRHRADALGPGVGLADRPRLRDPRRRQGAGPGRPSRTGWACVPRPSSRACRSDRCWTPRSARSPCPDDESPVKGRR